MSNTAEKTTIVSLFHTRDHAAAAMRDLQSAGIPTSATQSIGGESHGSAAPEQSLAQLRTLNLPERDLQILSDGLKNGGSIIIVQAEYAITEKAESILERHSLSKIDERSTQTQPQAKATPTAATTGTTATTGNTAIPIVEEELVVGKRRVDRGGVRVMSRLVETPVQEQVTLTEEHATVVRTPVNRPITDADATAFKERSIEVQEMGEEAVVAKTARVVEEISVSKDATERTEQVKDSVRKTEVTVEKVAGEEINKTGRRS